MITTGPDEFVIVGFRYQTGGGVDGNVLAMKVNADGAVLWTSEYASGAEFSSRDVVLLPDGGIMIMALRFALPISRLGLVKLDGNGGLVWGKVFSAASGSLSASTMIPNTDGGCILCGSVGSTTLFVARLDHLGAIQWKHGYGASGQSFYPTDLLRTETGDLVVSATRYLSDTVQANTLLLLDSSGHLLDHFSSRPDQQVTGGRKMVLMEDASLTMAGYIDSIATYNADIELVRIPMSAEGFSGECHSFDAVVDTVVLQEFTTSSNVSAEPPPTLNVTALSWPAVPGGTSTLVCTNVSIRDRELGLPQIRCFPNPARDVLTLQLQEGAFISNLVVFDDQGRVVRSAHDLVHNDLNIRGLDPGHYAVCGSFRSGDPFRLSFIAE